MALKFIFVVLIFSACLSAQSSGVEYQSGTSIEVSSGATLEADAFSGGGTVTGGENIIIGGSPLPVEMVNFSAKVRNNSVILEWQTATEVNNYGFEIERAGPGEQQSPERYTVIGFVQGSGNSNSAKTYSFVDKGTPKGKVQYRLKQLDTDGSFSYLPKIEVEIEVPLQFAMHQNFPNPFNPSTTITFTLAEDGLTTLKIYDILGREVMTIVNGDLKAGLVHSVNFDGSKLISGVYFYKLESRNQSQIKRFVLIR